jgi:ribose-phosphate pyrophosphokinase
MPWFPYSRQDRKSSPREPISARLVAEVVEAAGAGRVLTMDLHAGQIQGFFRVPVDHMTALPLFAERFHRTLPRGEPLAVVSPDLGRVKLARRLAGQLGAELAVVVKTRPAHDVAEATGVVGDVRGKVVLLGDDMIVTGGTLVAAAEAVLAAGAAEVRAFATHALFTPGALDRLAGAGMAEIAVTDTVALDEDAAGKVTVVSVAGILAQTIENVFSGGSVSAVFAGRNEPF